MLRVAEAVQRTDTGRQREANEDSYFSRAPVFAVADGMGGAQAGEVASRIAADAFEPERDSGMPPERYLRETAERANQEIFEFAQGDSTRSGMGTTLTAALIDGHEVSFGHVGDSRAYLLRDGELSQLTNDHSLVEELRRQGKLTSDQAADHPQRSVITRALGPEPVVAVDTMTVQARDGDVFLLCSDGLTTMLEDAEIARILDRSDDLDGAARRLVRAANEQGGRDNITVVLFRLEDPERSTSRDVEGATLVGATAADAGLTAEAVAETAEREPVPAVARAEQPPRRRGWGRRSLKLLALLAVLAVVAGGAVLGARQVWFLGADEGGRVTLYRGLPYELPFGIDLFSETYSSPITIDSLPEERRAVATDHELRSRDDAISLLEDLQRSVEQAQSPTSGGADGSGLGGSGSGQGGRGGGSG